MSSCRPLAGTVPKPRKGDQRATILRQLAMSDWGSPPDLKNRRPPTLRDRLEPFGPDAYAAATEGIAGIPKTMDRLRPKTRALAFLGSGRLAAKAPCKGSKD